MDFYVIGSREIVLAFKLVGVHGSPVDTRSEALDAFNRCTGQGGAPIEGGIPRVLVLTEDVAALIEDEEIDWQKTGKYPLIVEVPGLDGHIEGKKSLTDAIREAVGVQV